jgi:hypothetical protein
VSLSDWWQYQAGKVRPVKGYGKGRRIEAPKVEPKPEPIEVREDPISQTGIQRIIKAFRGD